MPLFEPVKPGERPPLALLDDPAGPDGQGYSEEALEAMSRLVELKLQGFRRGSRGGLRLTRAPWSPVSNSIPAPGVKVSQISNLAKDLARSLSAISVRVVEVIPGKPYVGLEIPNEARELVTLGEILKSQAYEDMAHR